MPWVINGKRYKPAAHPPFVWGGDTVPRNSLRGHNAADLEARGAVWEDPPAPPEPPPKPLADVIAEYRKRVDEDAERERLIYITPGDGQAMTYLEKLEQAKAVDAIGQSAADALTTEQARAQYPILQAGVGIHAETLWGHAQLVITKYEEWNDLAGVIETIREAGKKSISDASDQAAVIAVYEGITWPSQQT